MSTYVTVWSQSIKKRKGVHTGKVITEGHTYTTKTLTSMHKHIRDNHSDAITYQDPKRVITNFIPGMNIGMRPLVAGGVIIAKAGELA